MIKTLKSIAPLRLGVILAAIHALFSLIFVVPFVLFFAVMAGAMPQTPNGPSGLTLMITGVVASIFTPVLYGILGFIIGGVGAFFYNVIVTWTGGIQVEVE